MPSSCRRRSVAKKSPHAFVARSIVECAATTGRRCSQNVFGPPSPPERWTGWTARSHDAAAGRRPRGAPLMAMSSWPSSGCRGPAPTRLLRRPRREEHPGGTCRPRGALGQLRHARHPRWEESPEGTCRPRGALGQLRNASKGSTAGCKMPLRLQRPEDPEPPKVPWNGSLVACIKCTIQQRLSL